MGESRWLPQFFVGKQQKINGMLKFFKKTCYKMAISRSIKENNKKHVMSERIIITLASLLLLFGCEKWNPLPDKEPDEHEEEALTEFTVTLEDLSPTETKLSSPTNESKVKDLNLFLYNKEGELITHIYREIASPNELSFNLMARDGENCSVYAIANLGYKTEGYGKYQLEEAAYSVDHYSKMFGESGNCVMSGRKDFIVKKNEIVTVEMIRVMAKVTVVCNYDNLNRDVRLKIKRIRICNIPKQVKYFGKSCAGKASEVMSGKYYTETSLGSVSSTGVDFYTFENYQEANLGGAATNKEKADMLTQLQLKTCSYIMLEYEFLDPQKVGTIGYRFFLGKSMEDVIVERNNHYTATVFFRGNASRDELSVSVDNSNLKDRPISIRVTPKKLSFTKLGVSSQLNAYVSPTTAYNKKVVWNSSNPAVATVDGNGLVTSVSNGSCTIKATSAENSSIYDTAEVTVEEETVTEDDYIAFDKTSLLMLDIDTREIGFRTNEHNTKTPRFTVSDKEVVEITEQTEGSIKIRALKPGVCTITGTLGDAETVCSVTVEELKIVTDDEITVYKDFYHNVDYEILPRWAAASHQLKWEITDGLGTPVFDFAEGIVGNKIVGLVPTENTGMEAGELTVSFVDAPQKSVAIKVNVKDAIKMRGKITAIANAGRSDTYESLDIEAPEQASVNLGFTERNPGSYISAYRESPGYGKGCIKISNPCGANGRYLLTATVTGDNGRVNRATCTIEVYEQVYLVGISKSMDIIKSNHKTIGGVEYITISYENEIVAKYLAHPSSLLFPRGEIRGIPFSFYYNGKHFTEDHTDYTEIAGPFEFNSRERYSLAFGKGTGKSLYPPKYLEYFTLEADNKGYMITDNNLYLYITSRPFGGGFCDESISWQEIFEYIYQ